MFTLNSEYAICRTNKPQKGENPNQKNHEDDFFSAFNVIKGQNKTKIESGNDQKVLNQRKKFVNISIANNKRYE